MELITSRENAAVRELAGLLAHKKLRDAAGLFALEGARLCIDAAESGLALRTLYLTRQAAARYPALRPLADQAARVVWLHEDLAARIGETRTPQGVFCICRKLDNGECAVTIKANGKYVILSDLQDPGNLGTILRTAYALGIDGVFACGCPDLYAPKVLRAAMGGVFRQRIAVCGDAAAVVSRLRERGVAVYAAALGADANPPQVLRRDESCAVLIGNEGGGLAAPLIAAAGALVAVPMVPGANSLNAASASAILIWEMVRARW